MIKILTWLEGAPRLLCRLTGHKWSPDPRGFQVCTRPACRGHNDAIR